MNTKLNMLLSAGLLASVTETVAAGGAVKADFLCPVTGKPPVGKPGESAPMEGPPKGAYWKKDGTIAFYSAEGKRQGNPGGPRGPKVRTALIPLSVMVNPVTNYLHPKANESDAAKAKRLSNNAAFFLQTFGADLEAVIPGKEGMRVTRSKEELSAMLAKGLAAKTIQPTEIIQFLADNTHYQQGATEGKRGTLASLAKKYPDKAASVQMEKVGAVDLGFQWKDAFRIVAVAGDNGEKGAEADDEASE